MRDRAVSVGDQRSCAIQDGALFCWVANVMHHRTGTSLEGVASNV